MSAPTSSSASVTRAMAPGALSHTRCTLDTRTPGAVVTRLNAAINNVLKEPDIREKLLAQGAEAASSTPAEFDALIKDELKKWEYVIREAKITPE